MKQSLAGLLMFGLILLEVLAFNHITAFRDVFGGCAPPYDEIAMMLVQFFSVENLIFIGLLGR